MKTFFTWNDFDRSVEYIAKKCEFTKFSGIYGIPRGGLCLAVALSHRLKINLISEPKNYSLIVDDVYETGITLNSYKDIKGATYFVLVSKTKPLWWNAVNISQEEDWIVFPWENKGNSSYDQNKYKINRRLN